MKTEAQKAKHREEQRRYRAAHREAVNERGRAHNQIFYAARPGEKSMEGRAWKLRNREKMLAHQAIHRAIRDGKLVRPSTCSRCDNSAQRIEAHHPDYSKQLEVIWLCSVCHTEEHCRQREQERAK